MGLFDGRAGAGDACSTAEMAKLLDLPVILIVDCSHMARSAAAIVHGFSTFDPDLRVVGVILNKVAGATHGAMVREALAGGLPVVGVVPRRSDLQLDSRHLGLIPTVEDPAIGEVLGAHRGPRGAACGPRGRALSRRPGRRPGHDGRRRPRAGPVFVGPGGSFGRRGAAPPGGRAPATPPSASTTRTTSMCWRKKGPRSVCSALWPATACLRATPCTSAAATPRSMPRSWRRTTRCCRTCAPRLRTVCPSTPSAAAISTLAVRSSTGPGLTPWPGSFPPPRRWPRSGCASATWRRRPRAESPGGVRLRC